MPEAESGNAAPGDPRLLFKRGNESELSYRLKWTAWEWLFKIGGCRSIAFEVRLEGPFGRIADVVGIGPGNRVYLVEVKATRSDKSRDDNSHRDLERLENSEPVVEESISFTAGVLEAAATYARSEAGSGDEWRQNDGYRQALGEHARQVARRGRLRDRIATFSTKFHDPAYLRCAHYHYLMAPAGMIRATEIPPLWGLLDQNLQVRVEAPFKQVPEATRHVLRSIARSNSRDLMNAYGVRREKGGPVFPVWDDA
jgi:hypothetical protein